MLYPWLDKYWQHIKSGNLKTFQPLLIAGAEGRGQWDLAQHVSKSFLCENTDKPCGFCQSCKLFDEKIHPDCWYFPDEDGETLSIDTARLMAEHTYQKPLRGDGCRVVLIEHFDRATIAAQQSLLKVFEEPFVKTAFVLTTKHVDRVIPTMRSRMSIINIAPVSREVFFQFENAQYHADGDWLYDLTDGSPLLLKKYDLAQLAALKAAIEQQDPNVFALSKPFDRSVFYALVYHFLAKKAQTSLDIKDFKKLDRWQALYEEVGFSKSMNWELNVMTVAPFMFNTIEKQMET